MSYSQHMKSLSNAYGSSKWLDKNLNGVASNKTNRNSQVCKTMSFAHKNAPRGASLDYQCRFYHAFGSYLEPVTRTQENVGPGAYEISK